MIATLVLHCALLGLTVMAAVVTLVLGIVACDHVRAAWMRARTRRGLCPHALVSLGSPCPRCRGSSGPSPRG